MALQHFEPQQYFDPWLPSQLPSKQPERYVHFLNARESPLLRLPGEIRNQIYGYLFNDWHIQLYYKVSNTYDAFCSDDKSTSGKKKNKQDAMSGPFKRMVHNDGSEEHALPETDRVARISNTCRDLYLEINSYVTKINEVVINVMRHSDHWEYPKLFREFRDPVQCLVIKSERTVGDDDAFRDFIRWIKKTAPRLREWNGLKMIAVSFEDNDDIYERQLEQRHLRAMQPILDEVWNVEVGYRSPYVTVRKHFMNDWRF